MTRHSTVLLKCDRVREKQHEGYAPKLPIIITVIVIDARAMLEALNEKFELHIFTAGVRVYAMEVCHNLNT